MPLTIKINVNGELKIDENNRKNLLLLYLTKSIYSNIIYVKEWVHKQCVTNKLDYTTQLGKAKCGVFLYLSACPDYV